MIAALKKRMLPLLLAVTAVFGPWVFDRVVFPSIQTRTPTQFFLNSKSDQATGPLLIRLEDDLHQVFQSSPLSPIDFAVIISNAQRLGMRKAALAPTLVWDQPDPIALTALEQAIEKFQSVTLSAPLSRSATAEPIPAPFRRASIGLNEINGDSSFIPIINRISIPNTLLSGRNTLAGFQSLDSFESPHSIPMLARWDDRLVFSFSVIAALQHLGLQVEEIKVHPGHFLQIGPHGPRIPLDRYGCCPLPRSQPDSFNEISAEALIDAPTPTKPTSVTCLLQDARSSLDASARLFNQRTPATLITLMGWQPPLPSCANMRLDPMFEILILVALTVASWFLGQKLPFSTRVNFIIFALMMLSAHIALSHVAQIWLPTLASLSSLAVVYTMSPKSASVSSRKLNRKR